MLPPDTDDDAFNPTTLSRLLRLEWVFVHISALVDIPDRGSDGMTLAAPDGIFTRCIELRYTLADESRPGTAAQGGGNGGADRRMRERFGSGRWGWGEGRHIAVEIDPALERLKIRSVEVRG